MFSTPEAWQHSRPGIVMVSNSPSNSLGLPSGKHTKNDGKSPFLMGKSTMSMAIFNSYVKLPEGTYVYLISLQLPKS
jgi:hypothetical protein